MPKRLFRPPDYLVKQWPEVFEDMYMNTMPLLYLNSVQIKFKDGRIWEIDIKEQLLIFDPDTVVDKILGMFEEYNQEIEDIDFDIDTEKLKQDIKDRTKGMLG